MNSSTGTHKSRQNPQVLHNNNKKLNKLEIKDKSFNLRKVFYEKHTTNTYLVVKDKLFL